VNAVWSEQLMKINMHEFNECLSALAHGDPAARGKAISDLAKYSGAEWEKSPDAIPAAVTALMGAVERQNSRDPATRLEAAKGMGNIGTHAPEVVPALLKLLTHDPDEETRTEAARALGKIGAKAVAASKALVTVLKSSAGETLRGEAARALARVDPTTPGTATALRAAMNDRSGHVGVCAAEALWRVTSETEKVIPSLVSRLSDPSARDAAVQALYRIGTKAQAAVPALLVAAKAKDRLFRESVVMALKKIDPHAAAQAIG
jgi:HEAT repeat protein